MLWSPGFILAMKSIAQIDSVASQIGLKEPLVELMKPEVEKVVTQSVLTDISKETVYKTFLELIEAGKKLPQTVTDLQTLIHSGQVSIAPVTAQ